MFYILKNHFLCFSLLGSSGSDIEEPPPKPARPMHPMSPTGSTPNLATISVASLPNQWNSTTNIPLGSSTPMGPSPQHPHSATAPRSGDLGPREINLQHYFPSSSGYTSVGSGSATLVPEMTNMPDFVPETRQFPSAGRGGNLPVYSGYHVPRNPHELSEMLSTGHYQAPSPRSSTVIERPPQDTQFSPEVCIGCHAQIESLFILEQKNDFVKFLCINWICMNISNKQKYGIFFLVEFIFQDVFLYH